MTPRLQALPSILREALETAELLAHDLATQVVEGTASLDELDEARERFRRQLHAVAAYLRDEEEREAFALPRARRPAAPFGH
jgi:hypothetical protein